MSAQDGEIQQELRAEIVVVGFYPLLDLVSFSVKWDLKGIKYVEVRAQPQFLTNNSSKREIRLEFVCSVNVAVLSLLI